MAKEEDVVFHEHKKIDLSGYTLIEGFPGMGLVGTIAGKYLSEKLECEMLGHIESSTFVPIVRVHNGFLVFPSRIYASRKHKLAIIISEQVIPGFFTNRLAEAVVEWIKKKKIKNVISLSGIRAVPEAKSTVYGIASNVESKQMLKKHNIEPIKDGVTSGVTALILLKLKDEKINAISLMGNVELAADYKTASLLVEKLNSILGLKIDIAPLEKEAKETEKALLTHLEEMKKVADQQEKLEDKTVTGPQMYT